MQNNLDKLKASDTANQGDEEFAAEIPIAMIVAMAKNQAIGIDNRLPWKIPEDLQYFKQVTMGKPIIMGRKTFASIRRPLPGRTNIVLTANRRFAHPGVVVAHSVTEAREQAEAAALINGAEEIMVIGGAEIYAEFLPITRRLYVTWVETEVDADAYFPEVDFSQWHTLSHRQVKANEQVPWDYSFSQYVR